MKKYTINDFNRGDEVYHISNRSIRMVIINIYTDKNQIECRFLDKQGTSKIEIFYSEELRKYEGPPSIRVVSLR